MDLSHLFLSNDVPGTVEVSYIQHKIDEATAEIASLQERLTEALSRQNGYKILLSPMRRLPNEILGRSFEILLEAMPSSECRHALTPLCLVCKAWCDAALSTHSLWTRLEISADIGPESSEKAGHWLERAGSLPKALAVRSCGHFFDGEECPLVAQPVVAGLVAGGAIANLSLRFGFQTCFQEFTMLLDGRNGARDGWATTISSLKSFYISIDHEARGVFEDAFPQNLPAGISISLSLSQWSSTMDARRLLPRLTALELKLEWVEMSIFDVLHLCEELQRLTLDTQWKSVLRGIEDTEQAKRTLPSLRVFKLLNLRDPLQLSLVHVLNPPSLTELDVSFAKQSEIKGRHEVRFAMCIFPLLGVANYPKLRRIRVHSVTLPYQLHVSGAFTGLSQLTHIVFDDVGFDQSFFSCSFDQMPVVKGLLPCLELLELLNVPVHFSQYLNASLPDFLEVAGGGQGKNSKLERVKITYQPPYAVSPVGGLEGAWWAPIRRSLGAQVDIGFAST